MNEKKKKILSFLLKLYDNKLHKKITEHCKLTNKYTSETYLRIILNLLLKIKKQIL